MIYCLGSQKESGFAGAQVSFEKFGRLLIEHAVFQGLIRLGGVEKKLEPILNQS